MSRARWSVLAPLAVILVVGCASATYVDRDATGDDVIDAHVDAPIDASTDAPVSQCSQQPCSILPQCGCTTPAAPVCDLDGASFATGATKCRADAFHGTENTACTMPTTCAAEHVCVGRCRKYCDSDDDCAGAGGICIIKLTTGNPPMNIPGVTTCTTDCIPSAIDNSAVCPATWACHIYRESAGQQRYLTDCDPPPASGGTVGVVCTNNNSCRPGLDCVTLNPGGPQCRPTCICPGGNCAAGTCAAGTGSCRGYTTPVVIGPITYGACF